MRRVCGGVEKTEVTIRTMGLAGFTLQRREKATHITSTTSAFVPKVWEATALQKRYLTTVWRYAAARLSSTSEAEDVAAEVFIAAFQNMARCPKPALSLPENDQTRAWLIGITRRKVIDILRHRERRPEAVWEEGAALTTATDPTTSNLLAQESMQELYRVLTTLSPEHREALLLKYVDRLSLVEMGTVLGKSPKAVGSLLQRARAAAQEAGKEYFTP
jgi:RNA polymerase sigma-70 factor, ECF subfamily